MKKYTKEEISKMDAVDVYKLLLTNRIGRFPNGFWIRPDAIDNAIKCTKYLMENILKLSDEEIKEKLTYNLFRENKLKGMLMTCFGGSPFKCIQTTYPEKNFKPWEFNMAPLNYWQDINNSIEATKWLIETKLRFTDDEIKEKLNVKLFQQNGLGGMLGISFNGSPYNAINTAYPEKNIKPWEFKIVPQGYWTKKTGIEATKWLIEDKLKLSDEEIKEQLSQNLFIDNGLYGMLKHSFNGSPFDAISSTYSEKNFKPWEFKFVPLNYWTDISNGINATKWLIEDKLKLSDEEIKEQLSAKLFDDNGLGGMLRTCFNGSSYEAINATYPNKFKKSDFKGYN
ncbi:MAG: hypothetical protein IJH34_10255 [Romboutsia sp.]|nr:hypothetical protein [Romboutsia sp.]